MRYFKNRLKYLQFYVHGVYTIYNFLIQRNIYKSTYRNKKEAKIFTILCALCIYNTSLHNIQRNIYNSTNRSMKQQSNLVQCNSKILLIRHQEHNIKNSTSNRGCDIIHDYLNEIYTNRLKYLQFSVHCVYAINNLIIQKNINSSTYSRLKPLSVTVNFLSSCYSCLFPKHNMSITHNLIHISNGVVINFHQLCFGVLFFFAYFFLQNTM